MKKVSKTGFAKLTGVTRQQISLMTSVDKRLYPALVDNGKKINLEHPIVVDYIRERNEKRGISTPDNPELPKPFTPGKVPSTNKHSLPDEYLAMTLDDILREFGTDEQFVDWLKAVKEIENIKEKRLKNAITQKELVSRSYVETHIFSYIESSHIRLLTDTPRTIAIRLMDAMKAGEGKEELETLVRELISAPIKQVKSQVTRSFKNA